MCREKISIGKKLERMHENEHVGHFKGIFSLSYISIRLLILFASKRIEVNLDLISLIFACFVFFAYHIYLLLFTTIADEIASLINPTLTATDDVSGNPDTHTNNVKFNMSEVPVTSEGIINCISQLKTKKNQHDRNHY
jgi:hypothetical protein